MRDPVQIHTPAYYARLKSIESRHWWVLGMTDLMDILLRSQGSDGPIHRFFDLGCGSGVGLAWAQRRLPKSLRVGGDTSWHGLQHCSGLGAVLVRMDGGRPAFADGAFDLALCVDVLQHLADPAEAVRSLAQSLRPGGSLFVRTNANGFAAPPGGSVLYSVKRLRRELSGAGLEVVRISRANCLGGLAAEASRILSRNGHPQHHHQREDARLECVGVGADSSAESFAGGGYGGGLSLQAEARPGFGSRLKRASLRTEGWLLRMGLSLPFGHSVVALARRPKDA